MKNPLLKLKSPVAFDSETTGLNPWKGDRAFAWAFCDIDDNHVYFRWEVDPFTREVTVNRQQAEWMREFFGDDSIVKVAHNAKFDLRMLERIGMNEKGNRLFPKIEFKGTIHDTMFAMHCLRTAETLSLKPLCEKYLGFPVDDQTDLKLATQRARRQGKKLGWKVATDETHGDEPFNADYWMAPPELCEKYCVGDTQRTVTLWMLEEEKMAEEDVRRVYDEEMQLFWVTWRMESYGVRVDPKILDEEIARNQKILDEVDPKIQSLWKKAISKLSPIGKKEYPAALNVNSPKQLAYYLYTVKKHPIIQYSCKCMVGSKRKCRKDNHMLNPGTGTKILMAIDDPICRLVIEHKTAEKAKTGFFGRFKNLMVNHDGVYVLHPDFHQIGPVTGRYSCRNPNMQNVADVYATSAPIAIPARRAFIPRKDCVWYCIDYKQMELWLFASPKIANEEKMLKVLLSGEDLPTSVGIEMGWKKELENDKIINSGKTRVRVKLMLYGIIYGIGPSGLALLNKIPYEEACDDLDRFKDRYPKIRDYMDNTTRVASLNGFVRGPMGRRWQIDPDSAYKAANYMIQGSAAQVLKRAMLETDAWLRKENIDGRLILTVHDELVFEIHKRHENMKTILGLKRIMESYGKIFGIPKLPVDIERAKVDWQHKEMMNL